MGRLSLVGVGAIADPYYGVVVFLAGFDTNLNDEALGAVGTAVGNAARTTVSPVIGAGSLLLDGTGDWVTYPDSANWTMGASEAFTIELTIVWETNANTNVGFVSQWSNLVTDTAFSFFKGGANLIFRFRSNTITDIDTSAAWTPVNNTTYKLAVDRTAAGTVRTYVDGVMLGKSTGKTQVFTNSSQTLALGTIQLIANTDFKGRMDEVRITKGAARYASDSGYTPLTTPFPRS